MKHVLVVGGGPAGLAAAEAAAQAGLRVTVTDGKPSLARKFLMAGKSGLNITKDEPIERFIAHYDPSWIQNTVRDFGPDDVCEWARALDQDLFIGTTNRVFPKTMKASPLLRAWLAKLADMGVEFRRQHLWKGGLYNPTFTTPSGPVQIDADAVVFAMGGASWSRLGSTGHWANSFAAEGVELTPFQPSNVGLTLPWSEKMVQHFGAPVKNTALLAGGTSGRGEWVISKHGLEGAGIYAMIPQLRKTPDLAIDFAPDLTVDEIKTRLGKTRKSDSLGNRIRKAMRWDAAKLSVFFEFRDKAEPLETAIKRSKVPCGGPRPMDEAISTAGGIAQSAFDDGFMLKASPGAFVAGEMLDWDAPTGGYLITACLATGYAAGRHAAAFAKAQ